MGNMIVMCGKCGSGKTTYAKKLLRFLPDYRYIGIDECYAILNGDESIRENKFDAWQLFFRRIHDCEVLGQNCIIDTNAPYVVDRADFLNWFPCFDTYHLYWIDASDEECLLNNSKRARKIPEEHLMAVNSLFEEPSIGELTGRRKWNSMTHIKYNKGAFTIKEVNKL